MTEDIAAIQPNSYPISNTHLTEFTKRKNWIDRIINELKDFYHVITPTGKFIYCSPACQELVGYLPEEMIGRNLKEFIHIDDVDTFLRDFNLALKQREYRLFLRFRRKDDKFSMFEITGHPYFHERTNELKGFFSMARLYPAKTTSTMDSFLELRIENENLRRKLRNLGLEDTETPPYRSENRPSTGLSTPGSSNVHSPEGQADTLNELRSPTISSELLEAEALSRPKRKQKKNKTQTAKERVCTDCGTVDSPEWRKGPQGAKTLCNACGLRWAKQNRQVRPSELE